jgi:hypothetical protein
LKSPCSFVVLHHHDSACSHVLSTSVYDVHMSLTPTVSSPAVELPVNAVS